jgi:TolB protein
MHAFGFFLLLGVSLPVAAAAQATDPPERPTTGSGSWSPDGSQIVFASNQSGSMQIWLMNADGSGKLRLSDNEAIERYGNFSRDGRSIVFVSNATGNFEIWSMAVDGSRRRQLTDTPDFEAMPRFSPDGRSIYFARGATRDPPKSLHRMNVDGTGVRRLTETGNQIYPVPSPVDDRLLSAGNIPAGETIQIYLRVNEKAQPHIVGRRGLVSYNPDWSPDGEWVTFVGQSGSSLGSAAIYVVRADDSELRQLVEAPEGVFGPRWSPDGRTIMFRRGWTDHVGIFVINIDGTGPRQLTNTEWPTPASGQ